MAQGFTLVELMIAVVIVAVLASIAYPSYQDSVRKGRRAEAFAGLSAVQQAQERWRSNNSNYTTSLSSLGVSTPTPSGYYDISLGSSTVTGDTLATAYVATAVGVAGKSQEQDAQCRKLSARMRGGNIEYAGCGNCTSFTYGATNPCWAR